MLRTSAARTMLRVDAIPTRTTRVCRRLGLAALKLPPRGTQQALARGEASLRGRLGARRGKVSKELLRIRPLSDSTSQAIAALKRQEWGRSSHKCQVDWLSQSTTPRIIR